MTNMLDRVPPQAIEAEMAVIGAMLIEKEAVLAALDILTEKSFYKDLHAKIFSAIKDLHVNNKSVDLITVSDKLKPEPIFQEAGGTPYIASLIDSVQTAANIEHYANIVRSKEILRALINVSTEIGAEAFKEQTPPEDLLDKAQTKLFDLSVGQKRKGIVSVENLVWPALKNLEKLHSDKKDVPGLKTGFQAYNTMTAGLHNGELTIVAARPSMGKTAFVLNIAEHVASAEKLPVLIFSLEMSKEMLINRFISFMSRVDGQKMRKGRFVADEWSRIADNGRKLAGLKLFIDDTPDVSVVDVRARTRKLAHELENKNRPLALVIVDYLQLMRGSVKSSGEGRIAEISEISRGLKGLARDLNVPVIALSQLSRKVEDRGRKGNKPQLSDLRDSGAIEQDADNVTFLYREGYYNKNDPEARNSAIAIIAKQRNGPVGEIPLLFEPEYACFSDVAYRKEERGFE